MQEEFRVGVISNTHGLRGELKVFPTTDDVTRFKKLKNIRLVGNKRRLEVEIENVRFFKNIVIIKIVGYDDINEVMGFKGMDLIIDRNDAIELKENEYFISDIIGARVELEDKSLLGTVKNVIITGANEVFEVESEIYGQILIPSVKECIKKLDIENSLLVVSLLDGMITEPVKNMKEEKEE